MNCEDDDDWLREKFRKLVHNNISHNGLYSYCYNILRYLPTLILCVAYFIDNHILKMLMVLCTLFIHINIM